MTTPARDLTPEQALAYQRWLDQVVSLEAFTLAEQSHASRRGITCRFKAEDEDSARLIVAMGELASEHRPLIPVARAIIAGVNPHTSTAEWCAQAYRAARDALARGFDDVTKRSGPEPYRFKDCQRAYMVHEKVAVLATLRLLIDPYDGLGWVVEHFYATPAPNGYTPRAPRPIAARLEAVARERARRAEEHRAKEEERAKAIERWREQQANRT